MTNTAGHFLSPSQKIAWLRLIRTPGIGPQNFRKLVNRAGSVESALLAVPQLARELPGIGAIPGIPQAEDEIAAHDRIGARLVAVGEPDYPSLLAHIHGAPPIVSMMGGERVAGKPPIAIVGARNASAAGKRMTEILARGLGERGHSVVSGLARGIDAAAHAASLTHGTIAVLAGGLDRIYPEENIPLSRLIVESGGMLISELPLGWEPRAQDFPRRNRLVSGISMGVVVVEAARRSGSLITARLALEQDREVFAVPGSPLDQRSEGGNHLIREGARLVTSVDDIIEGLGKYDPQPRALFEPGWTPLSELEDLLPTDDDRSLLMEALSVTPTSIDTLVEATGLPISTVQQLLVELELADRLEWTGRHLLALKP